VPQPKTVQTPGYEQNSQKKKKKKKIQKSSFSIKLCADAANQFLEPAVV
jgi:hypothetical protein